MVEIAISQAAPDYAVQFLFTVTSTRLRASFSKISGIREEIEVVDMRDGLDPLQTRKIPGPHAGAVVTFSRGVTEHAIDIPKWFNAVKACEKDFRDDVAVSVGNCSRTAIRSFALRRAWPISYELGELDGRTSGILVESLSLAFETLDFAGSGGF